jgi:hypothetical protein
MAVAGWTMPHERRKGFSAFRTLFVRAIALSPALTFTPRENIFMFDRGLSAINTRT